MLSRIVLFACALGLVVLAAPAFVPSPVGTASASCTVVLDDGSCINPCFVAAEAIHAVDPKVPVYCPA